MTLTPDDIAADLHLSRDSVMRHLRTGGIPGFRVGRFWRVNECAYSNWKGGRSPVTPEVGFSPRSAGSEAALAREAKRQAAQ